VKLFVSILTGLLLVTLCAGTAFADLDGANVTVNYLFPDQNTIFQTLGTGTVTPAGFTVNSFVQHDFTVFPAELTLTNVFGSDVNFTDASFNGYQVVVNSGGSPITGVTLAFSDVPGFNINRVTFDATDVWINMADLTTSPGLDIQLDLQFGVTTPEPSSILLLGAGLMAGVGVFRRKLLG